MPKITFNKEQANTVFKEQRILELQALKVGNTVAIRGDLQISLPTWGQKWRCRYDSEQLVQGKYLKRTGTNGIWTGIVKKINGDMAFVGGGWRGICFLEKISD